jgi:hypothetical protein
MVPGGQRILLRPLLARLTLAAAITAVIEDQNIEPEAVKDAQ